MTLDQLIDELKHPLSAYESAWWAPLYGGRLVLFRRDAQEIVLVADGLTDADGHALAAEFNNFLRTLLRLKGPRNV